MHRLVFLLIILEFYYQNISNILVRSYVDRHSYITTLSTNEPHDPAYSPIEFGNVSRNPMKDYVPLTLNCFHS